MNVGFHAAAMPWHDDATALGWLAQMGYRVVALIPRRNGLRLADDGAVADATQLNVLAGELGVQLWLCLEGRFIDDPHRPGWPSLASEDPCVADRSLELASRWIKAAASIGVTTVTFCCGSTGGTTERHDEAVLDRLAHRIDVLLSLADQTGIALALRPERGGVVATTIHFDRLRQWVRRPGLLKLWADVDVMLQTGEIPVADRLARHGDCLAGLVMGMHHVTASESAGLRFDPAIMLDNLSGTGFDAPVIFQMSAADDPLRCPYDSAVRFMRGNV
ncbi:sugar phosphate isomerase/epimerase family protein [Crateriforma spongiae]|uniref:sugar phosphate isomerase/epimerase family protein n=1 Tax=Crateriforma spongiae TaxID=2724528 RepID=UPI0014455E10|nr:TIM barrel protein [Crateriforma spongiae]